MRDPSSPDETLGCQISPFHSIELHILYSEWFLVGRTELKARDVFIAILTSACTERERRCALLCTNSLCFNKAAQGSIVPGVGRKGGCLSHGLRTI